LYYFNQAIYYDLFQKEKFELNGMRKGYLGIIWVTKNFAGIVIYVKILGLKSGDTLQIFTLWKVERQGHF